MKTLILIDNHSLLFRFFYALPHLTTSRGNPVGGTYGLASILLKIFKEHRPDYIAAAFDRPEVTHRKNLFKEYKAHRPESTPDIIEQIKEAYHVYEAFGVPIFEKAGYEADDIIGTLVEKCKKEKDLVVIIVSGDLDMTQLVEGKKVVVKFLKKGISDTIIYDEHMVKERFDLNPCQIPDLKGLIGDASDNIPGVTGIGPKTATPLIKKFNTLENLFDNLWEIPDKLGNKLESQKEIALLSKKLATIYRDVDIPIDLHAMKTPQLNKERLIAYFTTFEFNSLKDRL